MSAARAVIFDVDGVLMDTDAIHRPAFAAVLAEHGRETFDFRDVAGLRTDDALRKLLPSLPPEQLALAVEKKRSIASALLRDHAALVEGATELVVALARTRQLGLATSGTRRTVEAFFALSGTASLFRAVVTGDEVARAKPDPEIYRRALGLVGTSASNTLVVEDAPAGVRAAVGAGMEVVGFARGRSAEALREAGAFTTVVRLQDLLELA